MDNRRIWNFIIQTYLGWLVVILFVTYYGLSILPHLVWPGQLEWPNPTLDYWIRWSNWDGGHFRGIAEGGYQPFQAVFFPLYPLLIKALMSIGIPSLWGGLLINQIATIIALWYLFKLVKLDFGDQIASKAILMILIFPTSFYLISAYSEALFLGLLLPAFYYARSGKWFLAFILAGLSAVTRLVGIGAIIAMTAEYYITNIPRFEWRYLLTNRLNRLLVYFSITILLSGLVTNLFASTENWLILGVVDTIYQPIGLITLFLLLMIVLSPLLKYTNWQKLTTLPTVWFLLGLVPLISYLLFLQTSQGDPWAFINHEASWRRQFTLPWITVVNFFTGLKMVNYLMIGGSAQALLELVFLLIFLVGLLFSLTKFRLSYTLFYAFALITPLFSGTLQAIHRYGLVLFPFFILLATAKNDYFEKIWPIFSIMLLGILSVLFINSFWVS